MKISAAAEKVGHPVKTIRYHSDIGLGTRAGRNAANGWTSSKIRVVRALM